MKKLFLTLITLMLCILVFAATPYKVTASRLNVRNQPGQQGAILGSLAQGASVDVVSVKNGWAEIRYNGQKAYISAQYITPAATTKTAEKTAANKNNSASNSSNNSNTGSSKSTVSKDNKSKGSGASSIDSDYIIAGFHASVGASWILHTQKVWAKNLQGNAEWQKMKLGKNYAISGLSIGVGLEYNGIVHRGRSLITVGFRSGVYYDWYGTKKLTPQDLGVSDGTDAGDYSDLLGGLGGLGDLDLSDYLGGGNNSSDDDDALGFKSYRYQTTLSPYPCSRSWPLNGKHLAASTSEPAFSPARYSRSA